MAAQPASFARIERGRMAADTVSGSFTQIHNAVFRDPRISAQAMGVFGHISTHRDGYGISPESIAKSMKNGIDSIKSALRELERFGYLVRTQTRTTAGKMGASIYKITDMPAGLAIIEGAPYVPGDASFPSSEPEGENPPTVPTCENVDADSANQDASFPSSEPSGDFPPAVKPPAGFPTPKNTSTEKNKLPPLPLRGSGGARTPTHASGRVREEDPLTQESLDPKDSPAEPNQDPHLTVVDSGSLDDDVAADDLEPAVKAERRGHRLAEDWAPSQQMLDWAAEDVPGIDVALETEKFLDRWCGRATKDGVKTDRGWNGAWRNWMRQARKFDQRDAQRASGVPELTPEAQEAAEKITGWWWGVCTARGPVLGSQDVLFALVAKALIAIAEHDPMEVTGKRVVDALRACDEPCPPPWKMQKALLGDAPSGGQARMSKDDQRRADNLKFHQEQVIKALRDDIESGRLDPNNPEQVAALRHSFRNEKWMTEGPNAPLQELLPAAAPAVRPVPERQRPMLRLTAEGNY